LRAKITSVVMGTSWIGCNAWMAREQTTHKRHDVVMLLGRGAEVRQKE
jgi:hypothetical protein